MAAKDTIQFGLKYRLYPTPAQADMISKWVGIKRFCWNQLVAWGRAYRNEHAVVAAKIDGKIVPLEIKIDNATTLEVNKALKPFLQKPPLRSEQMKAFARKLTKLKNETEWMQVIDPRLFAAIMQDYKATWESYWRKAKSGELSKEKAEYIHRKKLGGGKISFNRMDYWGEPQFKQKGNLDSFTIDRSYDLNLDERFISFRKITKQGVEGGIKVKIGCGDRLYDFDLQSRPKYYVHVVNERQNIETDLPKATPKKVIVKRLPSGRFMLTVTLATEINFAPTVSPNPADCVTIDLGSGRWLAYADQPIFNGSHYFENNRQLEKSLNRLKILQRGMSRKYRANKKQDESWSTAKTKNWEKNRIKVAKLHERIANLRSSIIYQFAHQVMSARYSTICLEDLDIKAMLKKELPQRNETGFDKTNAEIKSYFARLLSDASLFEIKRVLTYKAKWLGKAIVQSPKNSITFRECAKCGKVDDDLKIGTLSWNCQKCQSPLKKGPNSTKLIKRAAFAAL